ncbi:1563_t:CDS:2, partial [Funneliformis caledonium]
FVLFSSTFPSFGSDGVDESFCKEHLRQSGTFSDLIPLIKQHSLDVSEDIPLNIY